MTRAILLLALITIASAQFSTNFTQVLMGWGAQGVLVVPENITDPDGTTYFVLERVAVNQPDGQWTLDLINADGGITHLQNQNNDLVAVDPSGNVASISRQLPPLLHITGPQLITAVSNGVQSGVTNVYARPNLRRITTAQANVQANTVVASLLAAAKLPFFFVTPFKAQAANQIANSLNNAQRVSAAINASIVAQNPPPVQTSDEPTAEPTAETTGEPANNVTVHIPLNLTSFNVNSLENISHISASYGNESVQVNLENQTQAQAGDEAAWDVNFETMIDANADNSEWSLQWEDNNGNSWSTFNVDGHIVVREDNGNSTVDWSTEAALWADAENGDVDAAVGRAIEDFVDNVFANQDRNDNVVIHVGEDGLDWNYDEATAVPNA